MPTSEKDLKKLRPVIERCTRILVLTHNDPDPDALAASFGLATLLRHLQDAELTIDLAFGGILGRAENREMARLLKLPFQRLDGLTLDDYDCIALVDCQPGAGNHGLPESHLPDIVFDHHPRLKRSRDVPFRDIRPNLGATSTILAEYLNVVGVEWTEQLATALFYGIKTDTLGLSRGATDSDAQIYLQLHHHIDRYAIAKIEQAPLPRRYFQSLNDALSQAMVYSNLIMVDLGDVHRPDWVAEVADFFLRLDGIQWSVGFGVHDNALLVSVRSSNPELKAGRLVRRAVGTRGSAGGHVTMAAGQILLDERDRERERRRLKRRILHLLELGNIEGRLLLDKS